MGTEKAETGRKGGKIGMGISFDNKKGSEFAKELRMAVSDTIKSLDLENIPEKERIDRFCEGMLERFEDRFKKDIRYENEGEGKLGYHLRFGKYPIYTWDNRGDKECWGNEREVNIHFRSDGSISVDATLLEEGIYSAPKTAFKEQFVMEGALPFVEYLNNDQSVSLRKEWLSLQHEHDMWHKAFMDMAYGRKECHPSELGRWLADFSERYNACGEKVKAYDTDDFLKGFGIAYMTPLHLWGEDASHTKNEPVCIRTEGDMSYVYKFDVSNEEKEDVAGVRYSSKLLCILPKELVYDADFCILYTDDEELYREIKKDLYREKKTVFGSIDHIIENGFVSLLESEPISLSFAGDDIYIDVNQSYLDHFIESIDYDAVAKRADERMAEYGYDEDSDCSDKVWEMTMDDFREETYFAYENGDVVFYYHGDPRTELIPREDIEYIRKEAESLLKEKGIDTKNKDSVER